MNAEEITQLLRLLDYFEGLFDVTLGDWDTDPVDLGKKKQVLNRLIVNIIQSPELTRRPFA